MAPLACALGWRGANTKQTTTNLNYKHATTNTQLRPTTTTHQTNKHDKQAIKATYPDNFRVDYALSREQKNKSGGKMYIQDKVEEYSDIVFDLLDKGAHIYFVSIAAVGCTAVVLLLLLALVCLLLFVFVCDGAPRYNLCVRSCVRRLLTIVPQPAASPAHGNN